jgi:hypothetical protein
MQMQAFQPQGNTSAVTPTAVSQAVAIALISGNSPMALLVFNNSTNPVFIAFGTSAAVAAVVPIPGTPANGIPIPVNAYRAITIPNNATFMAYIQAVAGTGNLYFTGGEGV